MTKRMFVSLETHPEFLNEMRDLNLDITGDLITIDTEKKIVYTFPMMGNSRIISIDDTKLSYLLNTEQLLIKKRIH